VASRRLRPLPWASTSSTTRHHRRGFTATAVGGRVGQETCSPFGPASIQLQPSFGTCSPQRGPVAYQQKTSVRCRAVWWQSTASSVSAKYVAQRHLAIPVRGGHRQPTPPPARHRSDRLRRPSKWGLRVYSYLQAASDVLRHAFPQQPWWEPRHRTHAVASWLPGTGQSGWIPRSALAGGSTPPPTTANRVMCVDHQSSRGWWGLQWSDASLRANAPRMAVGQPCCHRPAGRRDPNRRQISAWSGVQGQVHRHIFGDPALFYSAALWSGHTSGGASAALRAS